MESLDITSNTLLSQYKGKKVFITGHTGFKGSWLTFILDLAGAFTLGYSLKPNTTPSLYANLTFSENHKSIIGDIRNNNTLENAILEFKPNYIFHLAAQPLVFESYLNPKENFETNFNGTLNLLEILRKSNLSCSVVLITTDKVYKNSNQNIPFKESDPLGGNDPYSASKAATEILIHSYNTSFFLSTDIKIATARAGNVIGGGDWSEKRIIPDIIRAIFEKQALEIRKPRAIRPWQHVLEPIFGYIALALKLDSEPVKYSGSWNFGPNIVDNLSVKSLVEIIEGLKYDLNVSFSDSKTFSEANFLRLNIEKAKDQLKFVPKWQAKKAIEKTVNWYNGFYNGVSVNELLFRDINNYLE